MCQQLLLVENSRGEVGDPFVHAVLGAQWDAGTDSHRMGLHIVIIQALQGAKEGVGQSLLGSLLAQDQRWELLLIAYEDETPGKAQGAQNGGNGELPRFVDDGNIKMQVRVFRSRSLC